MKKLIAFSLRSFHCLNLKNICLIFGQALAIVVSNSSFGLAADCTPFPENVMPQQIAQFVQNSPFLRVEDVVCKLPASLRSTYSIEFYSETGAAQDASLENPRIHMFNDNMVLTFNGNSQQSGGDEIEMGYQDTTRHDGVLIDLFLPGAHPQVRSAAKLGCLACHGSTEVRDSGVRFLFNAAPFWIGFYGGDGFGNEGALYKDGKVVNGEYELTEEQNFSAFKKMAAAHKRYKYLIGLNEKVLTNQEAMAKYPGEKGYPTGGTNDNHVMGHINLRYAFLLAKFNHDRLAAHILASPDYEHYRYAIFGSLIFCPGIETFLPARVQKYHSNEDFLNPFLRGKITKEKLDEAEKEARLHSILNYLETSGNQNFGDIFGNQEKSEFFNVYKQILTTDSPAVAKFSLDSYIKQEFYGANAGYGGLRYLFEGRLNPVSLREWSIDPKKGYYRFNNKPGIDDDETDIAPILRKLDPVLSKEDSLVPFDQLPNADAGHDPVSQSERTLACGTLKAASLRAFANYNPPSKIETKPSAYSLLTHNCMTCHTLGVLHAPIFDFSSQAAFEKFVSRGQTAYLGGSICDRIGRGEHDPRTMPKVGPLRYDEIESIRTYMRSLGVSAPGCKSTSSVPTDNGIIRSMQQWIGINNTH